MASVHDLCLLSSAVYDTDGGATAGKSGRWVTKRPPFGNADSGFYAVLFQAGYETVFAIRGTDFTQGSDLGADLELAVGSVPHQFPKADTAFKAALQFNGNRPMYLTGHSLGGGLASMLGAKHKMPTVTFNAPGMMRSYTSATSGTSPTSIAMTAMGTTSPGMMYAPATGPVAMGQQNAMLQQIKDRNAAQQKAGQLDISKMLNVRASDDIVSVGTGAAIGRVEPITVPRKGAEKGLHLARIFMPAMVTIDAAWHAFQQHRIVNVLDTVKGIGRYNSDLGWLPTTAPVPVKPKVNTTRMHVVVAGDSLSKLALRYYGNMQKWTHIYDVPKNKAAIGPNPNVIRAGLQLEIP